MILDDESHTEVIWLPNYMNEISIYSKKWNDSLDNNNDYKI